MVEGSEYGFYPSESKLSGLYPGSEQCKSGRDDADEGISCV